MQVKDQKALTAGYFTLICYSNKCRVSFLLRVRTKILLRCRSYLQNMSTLNKNVFVFCRYWLIFARALVILQKAKYSPLACTHHIQCISGFRLCWTLNLLNLSLKEPLLSVAHLQNLFLDHLLPIYKLYHITNIQNRITITSWQYFLFYTKFLN